MKIIDFFKNRKKSAFIDTLEDFKAYEDKYFIVIKYSDENGLEYTIASKEQKKKTSKKEED